MASKDPVERFREVHLPGPLERAVFTALRSAPSEHWSAAELAGHVAADEHAVDALLRQFAAAGIVEVHELRAGVDGYRMRPLSSFLPEEPAGLEMIDPVCGMRVRDDTPFVITSGAATLHFCSQRCLLVWERRSREAAAHDPGH